MELLDHPSRAKWEERNAWLLRAEESTRHPDASYLMSAHATLIIYDIHGAFCAGAWVSVIVLCHAAIDSTIRDTEIADYQSSSWKILGASDELHSLRKLRNKLVHVSEDGLEKIADFDIFHSNLENEARKAVQLLFRTVYTSPGT